MSPTAPQLALRRVSRRYGDQGQWFALREASLRIDRGEFLAIVGPSGSGKSTLLNILGLLDYAWEGNVQIDGVNVEDLKHTERDLLRSKMFGFVFQSSYANPYESTSRNAALGLAIQGEHLQEQRLRVTDALDMVGLTGKANSLARTLSGGERQRLALARAIATRPRVLLADEPTGNLDSVSATRVMELLTDLNRQGVTIVVVTHDRSVAKHAHRIVEVRDGVVLDPAPQPPQAPGLHPQLDDAQSRGSVQDPPIHRRRILRRGVERALRAINNVSSRPLRSATLSAAFAIAIAGMVTASGIGASASQQIADRLDTAALDEVRIEVPADMSRDERLDRIDKITSLPHVAAVGEFAPLDASMAGTSRLNYGQGFGADTFSGTTVAADEAALSLLEVETVPSRAARSLDSGRVALVGKGVLEDLGLPAVGYGAEVWIADKPYSVIGTISTAARAPNLVTSVVIPVASLTDPSAQLLVRTETGYSASVADAIPLALSPSAPAEVTVSTTADLRNLRLGVSQDLNGLLASVSFALLALAVLGASAAMFLSIQARIQELALNRALGLSRAGVATVFIWEGTIIGLAGSLAGLAIGLGASVAIAAVQGWTATIPWSALAQAPLVGIFSGALSACLPAIRAARVDPAEAIR